MDYLPSRRSGAKFLINSHSIATIIIDPDGKIIYRGSGSNSTDKLRAKLEEIFPGNK